MAKFVPIKTEETQYPNTWNPLRYLSERQIEMMLDNARSGRISQLQALYAIVETQCLTLAMCISRRESALPDWTIKRRDTRRYRSYDEKLAKEQESFLYDQFVQCEDSGTLLQALDTLHKAVFRGIGVVLPIYDKFGLQKIISLDPWNFAVDYTRHNEFGQYPLYWNPAGTDIIDFKDSLERIPDEEVVANFSNAPIDSFGLQIFLAQQMGFESYNKLIARKGLPATYIIAPEDLPSENLQTWADKAVDCARGGSGAFPFGSNVITQEISPAASTSIENFLEYMSKQIVLASTGGTLASLAQATGLGSNIADVQNDVFKSIVRKDAYKIGDLINRGIAKKLLNEQFPGKPHLAYFDLADEEKQSADKYLDDAVKAKSAGLSIDMNQLQELTGYKLTPVEEEKKEEGSIWNVPRLNAEKPEDKNAVEEWRATEVAEKTEEEEKPQEVANSEAEVEEAVEEKITTPSESDIQHGVGILKAFDKMLEPIRNLFARLFTVKTKEESDSIVAAIQDEMTKIEQSDDNELVKAVTQLMLDSFEDKGGDTCEAVANSECHVTDHLCRIHDASTIAALKHKPPEDMEKDGDTAPQQAVQGHKPSTDGSTQESEKARKKREKTERQKKNEAKGNTSMAIVESGKDCPDFMKSEVYGTIGFYQGNKDGGYVHIKTHEPDKKTGRYNHQDMLKDGNIPNTLAFGGYYPDGREVVVKHGDKYVVLAQGWSGWYIRTAYIDYTGEKARLFPPTRHKVENKKDDGGAF